MAIKGFFSIVFVFIAIFLFIFYWFIPFDATEFLESTDKNFNFSLDNSDENLQFYKNMRYPNSNISYKIQDCPLYKKNSIDQAFEIISNLTILDFSPVSYGEEISAFCSDRGKRKEGLFVAGEGGPINITKTEDFNVIFHGEILLIRESKCAEPNIGLHEILHALGFDHSSNKNSIMYNVSKCNQKIGEDIINKINEVYSFPSYPDLSFENVSAIMHGKYLDANISIRNNGLSKSGKAKLIIYAGEKNVKELDLDPMEIGYGTTISLRNIWIPKINIFELRFLIDYNLPELKKNNNEKKLEIKNKN
jgi:hypothetical protein